MRFWKAMLSLCLCLALCAAFVPPVQAEAAEVTVYLDPQGGDDAADGLTEATAVKTFNGAYDKIRTAGGGTIVFISTLELPEEKRLPTEESAVPVILTSKDGSQGITANDDIRFNAPVTLENMTIKLNTASAASFICGEGKKLVIGENVTSIDTDGYYFSVIGGKRWSGCASADVTIQSGTWRNVYAATYGYSSGTAKVTGNADLTITGGRITGVIAPSYTNGATVGGNVTMTLSNTSAATLYGTPVKSGTVSGNVTITLGEGAVITDALYAGGNGTGKVNGNVNVVVDGADTTGYGKLSGKGTADFTGTIQKSVLLYQKGVLGTHSDFDEVIDVSAPVQKILRGDLNGDDLVSDSDAMYLLRHTLFGDSRYPINQSGDMDGDGRVSDSDAMYLLRHTLFGDSRYPLSAGVHLILNADGSYGGSAAVLTYGKGAPLNGQYDVADSAYYTVNNDYFHMSSTPERVIFPEFASYQQTMQDSSGIACLLMVLHYMGEDVRSQYTELSLVQKYEEINGTQIYGNGTTEEGLVNLIHSLNLGYTATNRDPVYGDDFTKDNTARFFMDAIKDGKFVLVRYQSAVGYSWTLVIGYDNLGNIKNTLTEEELDHFGDDVIIFAEPYDGYDHHQDGYATERAQDFYTWWRRMEVAGAVTDTYSYVIIDPDLDITFRYQPVDETVKQTQYEIHLPRNPDGTYGGTRDQTLYGAITSGRGWWDHPESNYYKINDFYNMGSEGTRILLPNYTVLQQTMSSSCGHCAVTGVLTYYGKDKRDPYELELLYVKQYEETNNATVKGNGSNNTYHKKALNAWGYTAAVKVATGASSNGGVVPFPTYASYMEYMRANLSQGLPIVVATNLGSSHYLTVIGMDDMGTDYIYDDVIITADSCDYWDGYQDGYNVYSAYKFYSQHTNGKLSQLQSSLVIAK